MSDSPYRTGADFVLNEPLHCLFCGEERLPGGDCKKCHAWCGASPNDETPDAGFPCPRCKRTYLRVDSYGRAKVKICERCNGMFVPALQFSFIVNDYIADVSLPIGSLPPPPPSGASTLETRFEKVVCIACHREMDRLNFASRSGATIDVCNMHGIWLDAGELVAILHFVKTRAALGDVPLSDQEKLEEVEAERARIGSTQRECLAALAAADLRYSLPYQGRVSRQHPFSAPLFDFLVWLLTGGWND